MDFLPFDKVTEAPAAVSLSIPSELLWLVFLLVFLIFAVFSLILVYHWSKFGSGAPGVYLAQIVYFVGALALFSGMVSALFLF